MHSAQKKPKSGDIPFQIDPLYTFYTRLIPILKANGETSSPRTPMTPKG